MKTAVYEYKCRRCKEIFDGPETSEKNAHNYLIHMLISDDPGPGIPLTRESTHECNNKGVGVGDIIGYRVEDQL